MQYTQYYIKGLPLYYCIMNEAKKTNFNQTNDFYSFTMDDP